MAGYEFGTLARKLPQDPAPTLPAAYPFFRRSDNMEDRRAEQLTPLQEAMLLMNIPDPARPHAAAATMAPVGVTPLGLQAGMLDVHPSHERWLAERIGLLPSTITASARR
jgi:hypothetical protein